MRVRSVVARAEFLTYNKMAFQRVSSKVATEEFITYNMWLVFQRV